MTPASSPNPTSQAIALAAQFYSQGLLESAALNCRLALANDPASSDGYSLFGGVADAAGHAMIGIALVQRAIRLNPRSPDHPYDLGLILAGLGHHREAAEAFGHSLHLAPLDPQVWVAAGHAFSPEDAEHAFLCFGRGALVAPDMALAHREMAKLLLSAQRPEQAARRFARALVCQPFDPDSHNDLGKLAYEGKSADQAFRHFSTAAILAPAHSTTVKNLALAAQARHDEETAFRWHLRAAQLEPDNPELQNNLAESLLVAGRFDEAEPLLLRSAQLAPDNVRVQYALALGRTAQPGEPQRDILETLARSTDAADHEARSLIHFALAKICLDLGEREAWFDHLLVANAEKRLLTDYDEAETMARFSQVKETFTPAFLAKKRDGANSSAQPVFVVGMPRSGSTLVEQILASHGRVHAAGERSDLPDLVAELGERKNELYPAFLPMMNEEDFASLGDNYLRRVCASAGSADRVTDKALGNYWYAGLIHLLFPNAKIIHTRRDPVDTCLSCFQRSFRVLNFTYDLAELGRYWSAYDDLMRHWHKVLPEGRILDVDYEALVADPQGQTARILDYCGLEWDDRCLDFHRTERPVRTASFMQVRKPIYTTSVGRWRPAADKIAPLIEALAGAKT